MSNRLLKADYSTTPSNAAYIKVQLLNHLNSGWIAWDDVQLLEPDPANVTTRQYYYAGGQRIAMRENGALYWLLTDHLGSTAITASADGTTELAELRYKAWGEYRDSGYAPSDTPTTYRFTGQREDATIGLYFYNARYYDAALGRFVQADTIVPNPADPQALNRYSYVRNNALKYVDPSGHRTCGPNADPLDETCDENMDNPGYGDDGPDATDQSDSFVWSVLWWLYLGGNTSAQAPQPVDILVGPDTEIPAARGSWYGTLGRGTARGTGATWGVLRWWRNILLTDNAIINTSIGQRGGARYLQLHAHRLNGIDDVWHINANIGPLARFNHTRVPSIARWARPLAKALVVAGVAVDIYDLGSAAKRDYDNAGGSWNFGPNTRHAVGRVAGGWGGALGLAATGMAVCGPAGPLCAVGGGIIGGFGGSALGDWIASWWD